MKKINIFILAVFFLIGINLITPINFLYAQEITKIEAATFDQFQKVAPGESLPVSLKLLNMGGSGRVDVQITYRIEDANNKIYSQESETVAVETTASFIKQILIPPDLKSGRYFTYVELQYSDQKSPATTSLPFFVEYKFLGFFLNQWLIIAGVIIFGVISIMMLLHYISRSRRVIVSNFDYKKVPGNLKPYYELVSDIILTMRLHLGDKAIALANKIEGLKVSSAGEVLEIKKEPMEIVTLLTLAYQKNLGYNGLILSQKALNQRAKSSEETAKAEYQKTAKLLGSVSKYFISK